MLASWRGSLMAFGAFVALAGGCGIDVGAVFSADDTSSTGEGGTTTTSSRVSVGTSGGDDVDVSASVGPGGGGPVGTGGGGGGGAPVTSSSSSGGGDTGPGGAAPIDPIGCADGTRELFEAQLVHPDIAGCDGAFQVPGVTTSASFSPQCNRTAGNDGTNPMGVGCSVADLCAEGWRVCASAADVQANSGTTLCESPFGDDRFYLTRQVQNTQSNCINGGDDNNITGCGNFGTMSDVASCFPLNRTLRFVDCNTVAGWSCGTGANQFSEASVVTKTS
ncbi:MAG: hypothetical protein AAGN82_26610, partial [Myxococcota bacterium]